MKRIKSNDWKIIEEIGKRIELLEKGFRKGNNEKCEIEEKLLEKYSLPKIIEDDEFEVGKEYRIIYKTIENASRFKSYYEKEININDYELAIEKITDCYIYGKFRKIQKIKHNRGDNMSNFFQSWQFYPVWLYDYLLDKDEEDEYDEDEEGDDEEDE